MEETCFTFYSPFAVQDSGKLLHQCQAIKRQDGQNEQVHMALLERCMVQSGNKGNITIPFDFELKYSFMNNPPSIILNKMEEEVSYILYSEADLKKWREILSQKINQLCFHEQFQPLQKIGRGNHVSLYLVYKLQDSKRYAVLAYSKETNYNQEKGKERIINQIKIMRSLSHKNLMKLFEVFESQNSIYFVAEHFEGGRLAEKIKGHSNLEQNRFKPNQTKQMVSSILKGIQEMHSKNIMHRDLQPQNLMFRTEGSWDCVITGFALAEFSYEQEYLFLRCGTPGYIAPQIINITDRSTKYAPICDMFSLGVIFHTLLLGVTPFKGTSVPQIIQQNRASNFTFQGEEYSNLDPKALDLLVRMLKKDPSERISATEALRHSYFNQESNQKMADEQEEKEIKKVQLKMGELNIMGKEVETIPDNKMDEEYENGVSPKDSCQ